MSENMDRRKFLRNAVAAAVAAGGAGALEAVTNKAEATALDASEFAAFSFGNRMQMLFKLRVEKGSSKHEEFEKYFATELEKFFQNYARVANTPRTKTLEIKALNEAILQISREGWDSQIILRLSHEMKQRL